MDQQRNKRPRPTATSDSNPPTTATASSSTPASTPTAAISSATPVKRIKGLHHISHMVCKKCEEKQITSYSEVADELVKDYKQKQKELIETGDTDAIQFTRKGFDERNIRRRVYDALNVLEAIDIISKDNKTITWKGFPSSSFLESENNDLEAEFIAVSEELKKKKECLKELLVQNICFYNLSKLNKSRAAAQNSSDDASARRDSNRPEDASEEEKIYLPFVIIDVPDDATIRCDMNRSRTEVMLDFSKPFEIKDDNTILKSFGLDKIYESELRTIIPENFFEYCKDHGILDGILIEE